MRETEEENRRKMRTSQPHREADESQRIISLVKNLSIQLWETEEKNRTKDQSIKNLPTNERDWRGKPKDHRV